MAADAVEGIQGDLEAIRELWGTIAAINCTVHRGQRSTELTALFGSPDYGRAATLEIPVGLPNVEAAARESIHKCAVRIIGHLGEITRKLDAMCHAVVPRVESVPFDGAASKRKKR